MVNHSIAGDWIARKGTSEGKSKIANDYKHNSTHDYDKVFS